MEDRDDTGEIVGAVSEGLLALCTRLFEKVHDARPCCEWLRRRGLEVAQGRGGLLKVPMVPHACRHTAEACSKVNSQFGGGGDSRGDYRGCARAWECVHMIHMDMIHMGQADKAEHARWFGVCGGACRPMR